MALLFRFVHSEKDDPVTIWTVDSTCDYPCCRRVVAVQQGAITDTDESEVSTSGRDCGGVKYV